MIINHNLNAMNAHRQLGLTNTASSKSMEKLSSGYRINRAGDDAAGLSISEKMRGQIRGLNMASRNAQDGISLIQTAEGALSETHAILQRMRELAVQASSDTNVDVLDREAIHNEFQELLKEVDRIGTDTEFNTQKLLNGGGVEPATLTATATGTGEVTLADLPAVEEQLGEFTFSIDALLEDGDTIEIGGVSIDFVAGPSGDVNVTTANTATLQATAVAGLLQGDATFSAQYDVTDNNDGTLTITEKAGQASGTTLAIDDSGIGGSSDGAISSVEDTESIAATAGGATLTINTPFVAGDTLEIGGETYTFGSGAGFDVDTDTADTADNQATALAALIAGQDGIASAVATTNSITITQEAIEGEGFSATFQIGANQNQIMEISIGDMRAEALGIDNVSLATGADAREAITTINDAINEVSTQRSSLGAYQNRLEHTIKNLDNSAENLQAAESRIRDVDMAKEMMEFTKNNILQQAAQAMLAQANSQPQGILQLLR